MARDGEPEVVWSAFSRDPRVPAHAELRASDLDREVVLRVLGEAYADGRIDRDELDARTTQTQQTRTLGGLREPLEGLVATTAVPAVADVDVAARAVAGWHKERREALWGLISVSLIVWTIWVVGSWGPDGFDPYFPWPVFVSLAALLNLGRIQFQREQIVTEEQRRLEKKQRKELERRRRDEQDGETGSG